MGKSQIAQLFQEVTDYIGKVQNTVLFLAEVLSWVICGLSVFMSNVKLKLKYNFNLNYY